MLNDQPQPEIAASATLEELLLSAEYLLSEGNYEVMLCERGVRTFADHTRNTLDLSIVPDSAITRARVEVTFAYVGCASMRKWWSRVSV